MFIRLKSFYTTESLNRVSLVVQFIFITSTCITSSCSSYI